ncbi:MAG: ATP-binding protein [Thermodesulfovibrionales bacterium]|nr:ATP-binding protein [Thermodesulfovibrionales bacterium]
MKFIESETLELKKTTSEIKEAIISIAAILNKHQHGELFFGIKNNSTVTGQNVTEKTIRDVSKSIADHIEPKIYPHIEKWGRGVSSLYSQKSLIPNSAR